MDTIKIKVEVEVPEDERCYFERGGACDFFQMDYYGDYCSFFHTKISSYIPGPACIEARKSAVRLYK